MTREYAGAAAPPGRGAGRGVLVRAFARARRDGVDLLLPLVRHSGAGWSVAALEPEQPRAAGRRLLAVLPGARVVLEQQQARRRSADGPDRGGGRRRGGRFVVGPRVRRGRAPAAPPRG